MGQGLMTCERNRQAVKTSDTSVGLFAISRARILHFPSCFESSHSRAGGIGRGPKGGGGGEYCHI